ncbi:hypothetical protein [Mycobacterium sp. 236(2023)]|uniref:imine reductase family protein n=1 Tax=Mycobacterium sp. 236(2023) TaxID=3038163 RepID=UPI0032424632
MALLDVFWTATGGFLHALEIVRTQGITPDQLLPHGLGIASILPRSSPRSPNAWRRTGTTRSLRR